MPTDFRTIILKRLKQLGKSRYWLAEKVGDSPSRTSIYEFLRGEHDLYSAHVAKLLDVLDIETRVRPTGKRNT